MVPIASLEVAGLILLVEQSGLAMWLDKLRIRLHSPQLEWAEVGKNIDFSGQKRKEENSAKIIHL